MLRDYFFFLRPALFIRGHFNKEVFSLLKFSMQSSYGFREILDKYLNGEASPQEESLLFGFYEAYGSGNVGIELTEQEQQALF